MLPYPPSTRPDAAEHSLLRVLGGVLALLSILLALLSIILHQHVSDLILAFIVGMFALRVLLLWLGDKPQHQGPLAEWSSMEWRRHPTQSPPYPSGQPALPASPYFQARSLSQSSPEQHLQQSVPLAPAAVVPLSPKLPRSVRPQRPPEAPAFPAQAASPPQGGVQPLLPSQPRSLWLPPPSASVPMPSPTPVPGLSQQGNWQYDDGENVTQQQRGNDRGPA